MRDILIDFLSALLLFSMIIAIVYVVPMIYLAVTA